MYLNTSLKEIIPLLTLLNDIRNKNNIKLLKFSLFFILLSNRRNKKNYHTNSAEIIGCDFFSKHFLLDRLTSV